MMTSRIMETMLSFVVDTLSGDFENVKYYILHEIETGKGQWIKMVNPLQKYIKHIVGRNERDREERFEDENKRV